MDLNEMLVFARVVQAGSFTTAAKMLGMPKSTVSRKVAELEDRLGARLLQRSTRKLSLTDAGRTYYDYSARIVTEIEEAEQAVGSLQDTPRGLLRVTAPINVAFLGPIVSDFLARYPDVRIEMLCTARTVDMIEERFDVGIRAGALAESSLVARSLGSVRWFLVATPAYLKKRGRPKTPDDLMGHPFLAFGQGSDRVELRLTQEGEGGGRGAEGGGEGGRPEARTVLLTQPARLMVSDMDVLHAAALGGQGIALLPATSCLEDLRTRRLEQVLRDWSTPATPVHVVYASTRHVSAKVKRFVDHVHERMTPPPWESARVP